MPSLSRQPDTSSARRERKAKGAPGAERTEPLTPWDPHPVQVDCLAAAAGQPSGLNQERASRSSVSLVWELRNREHIHHSSSGGHEASEASDGGEAGGEG